MPQILKYPKGILVWMLFINLEVSIDFQNRSYICSRFLHANQHQWTCLSVQKSFPDLLQWSLQRIIWSLASCHKGEPQYFIFGFSINKHSHTASGHLALACLSAHKWKSSIFSCAEYLLSMHRFLNPTSPWRSMTVISMQNTLKKRIIIIGSSL